MACLVRRGDCCVCACAHELVGHSQSRKLHTTTKATTTNYSSDQRAEAEKLNLVQKTTLNIQRPNRCRRRRTRRDMDDLVLGSC